MPMKNAIVSNSILEFLGRPNRIREVCQLFDKMMEKDVNSWVALISFYEQHTHKLWIYLCKCVLIAFS